MGNSFGSYLQTNYDSWTKPESTPKTWEQPKHDPLYGFTEREERGTKELFFTKGTFFNTFYVIFQSFKGH